MRSRHLLKHDVAKGRTRALWDRYLDSSQFFRLLLLRLQVFGNIILNIFMIQTLCTVMQLFKGSYFRKRSTRKRRPKHEAPKTRKRSTQNSKTNHPKLENEAPKSRKRSSQISKPLYVEGLQLLSLAWRRPNQVEATDESVPSKVLLSIPRSIWFLACRGRAVSIFSWAFLSCHPFVYVSLC